MAEDGIFPIVYGLDQAPMVAFGDSGVSVQQRLLAPLELMSLAAERAGFQLRVASGFRSFDRQLQIWNAKAKGERSLLDSVGRPLAYTSLTAIERMYAILRWSALPGASRHHWGTDVDVYDGANLPEGYQLQLTVAETCDSGPFAAFHRWLDGYLCSSDNPGFFRPYAEDRGGIAPEPWHLSYAPLADPLAEQLSSDDLRSLIEGTDIQLKPEILANLDNIFARFVAVPTRG